jgi:CHRD domain
MKKLALSICALITIATTAAAHDDRRNVKRYFTKLVPHQEVPALVTTASGRFHAVLNERDQTIEYRLSYEGLEGDVLQAHLHLGQRGVNGGIMLWLCSNLASPPTPPNTPACPGPREGTVSGTLTPAQVVGPTGQNVLATEFAKAVEGLREGVVYANVHTTKFQPGEIRGQVREH